MRRNLGLGRLLVLAVLILGRASRGGTAGAVEAAEPAGPTPTTTAILANPADARFSRDYSLLLRQLRLPWFVLDTHVVPAAARDYNLLLLGGPETALTGDVVRDLASPEAVALLRDAGGPLVLPLENPWFTGKTIFVCAGADALQIRDAAEIAARDIIDAAPPTSAWIRNRFDAEPAADVDELLDELRFSWDDEELPLADLTMDQSARAPLFITQDEAAADVERLFYLFRHGYAGFGYFDGEGEFEKARTRILERLAERPLWTGLGLASLFHEELAFITDCHLKIGDHSFAGHADFWYDTDLALAPGPDGYHFVVGDRTYRLLTVDGESAGAYLHPSLDREGQPVYRLGVLSTGEPEALRLMAESESEKRVFEVDLQRSDFTYYSDDIFREETVGGIPVIRVRSFSDHHQDALRQFAATGAAHRGDPAVVVDLRGNGGGNEAWPISWIRGLTGRRAASIFIFSELHGKTADVGRANLFEHLLNSFPDVPLYRQDAERYAATAASYETGTRRPLWEGRNPALSLIPNETTVVVVMNGAVASAGEGFVMRASRAENVMVVGENSRGCLGFGNAGLHQLPHSRLEVSLPINFGLFPDLVFREGVGLAPDLWVPAADAVNAAVAALRSGTLTTAQPLSPELLEQPFVPENTWARRRKERLTVALLVTGAVAATGIWAYFMRRRPLPLLFFGVIWLVVGAVALDRGRSSGIAYLAAGGASLLAGIYFFRNTRSRKSDIAPSPPPP